MTRAFENRVVFLTGAASGIGRATAFAFAERGATLELADLDEAGLSRTALLCDKLGATGVHTHVADVASAERMESVAASVHERYAAVDILVNNAGVGVVGSYVGTDLETWRWALGVNVMGVVHGCHFFVPKMLARRAGGHVLNTASAAGYTAAKLMPVYVTSKYAVVGMSEALRAELKPKGIRVTTVCPGVIDTPITRNMRRAGNLVNHPEVNERAAALYKRRNYGPERVADALIKAVQSGHSGILPISPEAWLLYYGSRFTPRLLSAVLSRNL
ncbi:MAG: hypothetical protein RL701_5548 [Pseudomonadota bacterium]